MSLQTRVLAPRDLQGTLSLLLEFLGLALSSLLQVRVRAPRDLFFMIFAIILFQGLFKLGRNPENGKLYLDLPA